jgi:hypothetical protein
LAKDELGQIFGHPLFVESAFLERPLMKRSVVTRSRKKRVTTKDEEKDLQPVSAFLIRQSEQTAIVAWDGQNGRQLNL